MDHDPDSLLRARKNAQPEWTFCGQIAGKRATATTDTDALRRTLGRLLAQQIVQAWRVVVASGGNEARPPCMPRIPRVP